MVITDTLSEGTDIHSAEDLSDFDLYSDFEPKLQDIEILTEDKNDDEQEAPKKKRRKSQLNKVSLANDR